MPSRHIRTISLSPELDRFITDLVASGRYASASEVVRQGLRMLMPEMRNAEGHAHRAAGDGSTNARAAEPDSRSEQRDTRLAG